MLETEGDQLKETIRWNTRVGLALTGADVARALGLQTEMYERMRALLERMWPILAGAGGYDTREVIESAVRMMAPSKIASAGVLPSVRCASN